MNVLSKFNANYELRKGVSNMKWTKEQEQAIYKKESNILVAAAAR